MTSINVYCDESCHLLNDGEKVMVLGAVWCETRRARRIAEHLRGIKTIHGEKPKYELKWTRVQPSRKAMYLSVINYFFQEEELHFRALVVPDKGLLDHERFGQDHDTWYYKMYYDMLKVLFSPQHKYRIFIDIKDTRGGEKVRDLAEAIRLKLQDVDRKIIERLQIVKSHQVEQVQLADLLTGCVSSVNRGQTKSDAKKAVASRFKEKSGYQLTQTTLYGERMVNILRWDAS